MQMWNAEGGMQILQAQGHHEEPHEAERPLAKGTRLPK
jgi:hypothetical protein